MVLWVFVARLAHSRAEYIPVLQLYEMLCFPKRPGGASGGGQRFPDTLETEK